jgi:heat-inducible transcriptional repressor
VWWLKAISIAGAPVGSRTLSKVSGLNLSPASIRNVMQDLEEAGLLAAPHTSAGRMPTESGLRLFVDGMMQAAEPTAEERRVIESQIEGSGPIESALAAATAALSGLSACAGVVMVPKREVVLKQFSFARLSATQALAIMVGTQMAASKTVWSRLPLRSATARWSRLPIIFQRKAIRSDAF